MPAIDHAAIAADRVRLRRAHVDTSGRSSSARGVHHVALLCSDVRRTIAFYQDLLEFPLTEILENRDYRGSNHFFFDVGNGNLLAFFDFPGLDLGPYREVLGGLLHLSDPRGVDGTLDSTADNRDHRKALIVDSRVAFVGGIGFFDDNVQKWHDLHARLRGPAVGDVQRHFEEVWKIGGGSSLGDAVELYPSLAAEGSLAVDVVTTVPGVHDELKRVYLSHLRTAQRELLIENPYFTDSEVIDAVKAAARRGVKTTVILPPDDDNDVKLVGAHHTTTRVALLAAGVDLRAYPKMTHGKVAVVDGTWGTIGSANLDNRSLTRNLEENLSIDDARFASDLKERVFRPDVLRSKQWSPADKPTGFMKKAMGFVARIFEDWL